MNDEQEMKFLDEARKIREGDLRRALAGDEPIDWEPLETPLGDELDSGWAPEDDFADFNANEAQDYRDE